MHGAAMVAVFVDYQKVNLLGLSLELSMGLSVLSNFISEQ